MWMEKENRFGGREKDELGSVGWSIEKSWKERET